MQAPGFADYCRSPVYRAMNEDTPFVAAKNPFIRRITLLSTPQGPLRGKGRATPGRPEIRAPTGRMAPVNPDVAGARIYGRCRSPDFRAM
jgi:hypothetical protein